MTACFGDLTPFLDSSDGVPRPRWDSITQNISDRALGDAVWEVWNDALRRWLAAVAISFGKQYTVHESATFLLLSDLPAAEAEALANDAESAWRDIRQILGQIAEDGWYARRVIMAFGKKSPFVNYIAPLLPEGESMTPGGLLVTSGFLHVVLGPGWTGTRAAVLRHELTHLALAQLAAPMWLHEGLALLVQKRLSGASLLPEPELLHECRAYWRSTGLDNFWRGESFASPGRCSEFSYTLAEVLTRNIVAAHSECFEAFVRAAVWDDAADAAARTHLGISIADVAGEFLGAGEWGPNPVNIAASNSEHTHT